MEKVINGFNDLLTLDLPDIEIEECEIIEGEISEFVGLGFNLRTQEYFVQILDSTEEKIIIIENENDLDYLKSKGIEISKDIFEQFINLVKGVTNNESNKEKTNTFNN